PGPVVEHGCGVVHAIGEGDAADVGAALHQLLHGAMEVAVDDPRIDHRLAVEGDEEVENTVRAGVVRAEVYLHQVAAQVAPHRLLLVHGDTAPGVLGGKDLQLGHQVSGAARRGGAGAGRSAP